MLQTCHRGCSITVETAHDTSSQVNVLLDLKYRAQTSLAKVQTPLSYSLLANAKQKPSMAAVQSASSSVSCAWAWTTGGLAGQKDSPMGCNAFNNPAAGVRRHQASTPHRCDQRTGHSSVSPVRPPQPQAQVHEPSVMHLMQYVHVCACRAGYALWLETTVR